MRGIQILVFAGALAASSRASAEAVLIELRGAIKIAPVAASVTLEGRREAALAIEREIQPAQEQVAMLVESLGGTVTRRFRMVNVLAADVPPDARARLAEHPAVLEVGDDTRGALQMDLSVPAMAVRPVWEAGFTGAGQSVILLDSGVYAAHPAFTGRVRGESYLLPGAAGCPANEVSSANDFNGHGTHLAGVIASAGTMSFPNRAGVARGLSTLFNAKVACQEDGVLSSDRLAAIEQALVETPSSVVLNASTAPTETDDDIGARAIDSLISRFNLVWINAAGNTGPAASTVGTPGNAYNGITVANLDLQGTMDRTAAVIHPASSRGPTVGGRFKPDVSAPGTNVTGPSHLGDGFVARTGTSVAAAHIAGAAAVLRQAGVTNRLAMKALLINTTDVNGWGPNFGWGFVDVERAFRQRGTIAIADFPAEADRSIYYRVVVPGQQSYFATLVWERHLDGGVSTLRNLDLAAFNAVTGAAVQRSVTAQNVEQLAIRNNSSESATYLIQIEGRDAGAIPEPFAMASSLPLEAAIPAGLELGCEMPAPSQAGATVSIPCQVRNTGGLPLTNVNLSASIEGQAAGSVSSGPVGAQGSSMITLPVVVPALPGVYALRITATGLSFGNIIPITIDNTLTVAPPAGGALPLVTAAVSGASFTPGFASAGWLTLTGGNLATTSRGWMTEDFNGNALPTVLDGVSVTVNGRSAYVAYVSPTQVNILAPDDPVVGEVPIVVTNAMGRSLAFTATKSAVAPALFRLSADDGRFAAAVHADGAYVGPEGILGEMPSHPAVAGEIISLYATGCGATNPATSAANKITAPARLAGTARVSIGGIDARVDWAGVTGSGLCQINTVVPSLEGIEGPEHEVRLTINGVSSIEGIYIAVE